MLAQVLDRKLKLLQRDLFSVLLHESCLFRPANWLHGASPPPTPERQQACFHQNLMRVNIYTNSKQLIHKHVLFVSQQMQSMHLQERRQQVRTPKPGKPSHRRTVGRARLCSSGVAAGGAVVSTCLTEVGPGQGRSVWSLPVLRVGSSLGFGQLAHPVCQLPVSIKRTG